ncbi:MAG: Druantia anti-phage system protein DruA [Vicinamibacteria bacterium]
MTQARSSALDTRVHRPSFCGTPVTDDEWSVLVEIIDSCGLSRHELARTICEALGWVRPNGRLKTRECYEYLEVLEAKGMVKLPCRREQRPRGPTSINYTEAGRERPRREGKLADVAPVTLGLVANAEERALWRELVERYHYLGHKVAFGAHLRYLVWISRPRRELCGCMQVSSAARWLQARDGFIGWDDGSRQKNLPRVVNNSRFLIQPWLSIQGLASHVLSLAARVVVDDWEEAYRVRPVLLETFVERERYEGTCYRAANWVEVGPTSGRGRMDRHNKADEPVKTCLVLPLVRDFRRKLGVSR